ncbi:MAG: oligosaccharide flippase family protein, partial [Sphingomonadaceae bacterium]
HDREMVRFSGHILVSRLFGFAYANAAVFIVGFGLGAVAVGFYRAASRIAGAAFEAINEPSRTILLSSLRNADAAAPALDEARTRLAERLVPIILSLAAPVMVLLAVMAEPAIHFLLGDRWLPAAPVVSILSIAYLVKLMMIIIEPLFSLRGRPQYYRNLVICGSVISSLCLLAAVPFGMVAAAMSELVASIIVSAISLYAASRWAGFSIAVLVRTLWLPVAGLIVMALGTVLIRDRLLLAGWPDLAIIVLAGLTLLIVYFIIMWFNRSFREVVKGLYARQS